MAGVAAFFGALTNVSFMLSGSSSTNPVLLGVSFFPVPAWKVGGYIGVDLVLLPLLGTPWQHGNIVRRGEPDAPPKGQTVAR